MITFPCVLIFTLKWLYAHIGFMSCFFVKEHVEATVREENERTCWGCGLRLLLPSNAPVFKCGWCGAITNEHAQKRKDKSLWWRRWRDRCFVSVVSLFMLFILCKLLNQLSLSSRVVFPSCVALYY